MVTQCSQRKSLTEVDDGDAGEKAFTPGLHSVAITRSVVLEKIIVPISIGEHRHTEYDR